MAWPQKLPHSLVMPHMSHLHSTSPTTSSQAIYSPPSCSQFIPCPAMSSLHTCIRFICRQAVSRYLPNELTSI